MHLFKGNRVACVGREGDQNHTGHLGGQKEAGRDGAKESKEAVHAHGQKKQGDKGRKEFASREIKAHHKVRNDFIDKHYKKLEQERKVILFTLGKIVGDIHDDLSEIKCRRSVESVLFMLFENRTSGQETDELRL